MRERVEHVRPERLEIRRRHGPRQNEFVVLVGAERLLSPALATHDDKATGLADRLRRHEGEELCVQMTVEVGNDLAHDVDADALAAQHPDLQIDSLRRARKLSHGGRAVDPSRHQLRIAGEETQKIDVFEQADEFAVLGDRHPPLVVLRHLEQRSRDEVVGSDAYDRAARERPDRAFDGAAIENRCVQEIRPGHNAGFAAFAHQKGVAVSGLHSGAGVGDGVLRVHEHCGMEEKVANPRGQQRRKARRFLLPRRGPKLAGDVEVEERGKARILVDEPKRDVARKQVAERFLPGDESIGSAALHQGAAVERVAGAAQATRSSPSRSSTRPLMTMKRLSGALSRPTIVSFGRK